MKTIDRKTALEVLQHIQSRTDSVLINLDVYKPSPTGEEMIQRIESKAFDTWMEINDNKSDSLNQAEVKELQNLFNLLNFSTTSTNLGSSKTTEEVRTWEQELELVLLGKNKNEIDKWYLEKVIDPKLQAEKKTKKRG